MTNASSKTQTVFRTTAQVLVMGGLSSSAVAPGTLLDQWRPEPRDQIKSGDWEERREEELCPSAPIRTGKGCGAHARTKSSAAQEAWPQTLGGHVAITTETALPTPHLAFANFEDASAFGSDVGGEMKEREGGSGSACLPTPSYNQA